MSANRWVAEFRISPHSSGRGQEIDQKEAGERFQQVDFIARDIDQALAMAKMFQRGLERNPMVWQAPIIKLECSRS